MTLSASFHIIQSRPMPQPRDLTFMVCMGQVSLPLRAVQSPHLQDQAHAWLEVVSAQDVQLVFDVNIIIRRRIGERQRKHPLLLEVRLMNPRKAPCNHRHPSEESRLQSGVLAAGTFAVVPVADNAPSYACVPVLFCDFGDCVDDT
jgi:hypothetical protein